MKKPYWPVAIALAFGALLLTATLNGAGQPEPQTAPTQVDPQKIDPKKDFDPKKGPQVMVAGPGGQQRKLVKQFDKDGDGRLNNEERKAAREFLKKQGGPGGFGQKGFKGPFGPGGFLAKQLLDAIDTGKEGKVTQEQVVAAAKKFFQD